ncbi:MAG: hypothetical protein ACYC7A_22090 [Thermoanaerobaculia bacterium]
MPATQSSAPFFAANLLATASDGTWQAIRRARRVEAFDDRIEIDGRQIFYPWLRDIRAYGNVLHIEYILGDGRPVTECFLYNTFLSSTGAHRLDEMIARVAIALKRLEGSASLPRSWVATILAEPLTDIGGRAAVAVHSPRVAFPPVCPICIGDPTTVAALRVSSGISERGAWLVPTCDRHERLDEAIRVETWCGDSSEVRFSFANRRYAAEFLAMNATDDRSNFRRRGTSTRLAFDLQMGAQFVIYQYAVSVIVASFLQPSGVRIVRPGASRVIAGLPYTLLSLVAGWWGFPAGPVFTLTAIVRNCRGGTDVSDAVVTVLRGESLSALAI